MYKKINKNLFFTLPDNINLKNNLNKLKLSLKIYFYLFFLFRYFIFKESLFNFFELLYFLFDNRIFKKVYLKLNIYKYKYINYFFNFILLKLNIHKYLKNRIEKIVIKDIILLIYLYIFRKKKIYNYNFFWKNYNKRIYFFFDFSLRIPFIFFIAFKEYINKFKIFKYNEYLSKNLNLFNFPILKLILRVNWKINTSYTIGSNNNIFHNYKIYFDNMLYNYETDSNKNNNLIKLNLFINKFNFIKLLFLFNKNLYLYLLRYFKIYFINIFFLYIYNIWLLQLYISKEIDWIESSRWNIFYLLHLYWWLYKYNFNLPIWLYILVIINIIKIYLKNKFYILNAFYLDDIKNKEYISNISNLISYKITSIILIIYFEKLYFKFFSKFEKKQLRFLKYKWKKLWKLIIKNYPFDFLNLPLYYNKKYFSVYLKKYVYNFDLMHWKLFFNSIKLSNCIDLNAITAFKSIQLDNFIELKNGNFFNNIINYLENKKENLLINFLFCFSFLRDLFLKILFSNILNRKIFFKYFIKKNIQVFKQISKKDFKSEIFKLYYMDSWLTYKKNNSLLYNRFYEKSICLIIYVIFIKKYTK